MSMDIFILCGCAVVVCVLIITVRQHRPDIAVVLSIAAGVILFAYIAFDLRDVVSSVYGMIDQLDGLQEETGAVVKALGVCLVTQLAADVCRDAGQSTVASRVELGGRAAVLVMLLPLLGSVLEISTQLISG